MKRSWWLALSLVAAVVIVVVLVRGKHGAAPKYRTAPVERGSIEVLVSATGTINPVTQVEVGSQVSGTVAAVHADYNDRVRRGEVLCQIDPSSFNARFVAGEAGVARAEAALADARRQLTRANELVKAEVISQVEADAAKLAADQRAAELKQARAQADQSRVDLANTTIRSPIDGVVIARSIDVGQTVAASLQSPKLFVIANDLTQMQVETRIDEADIGVVRAGLPVRFTVDAFPDEAFDGVVAQVRLEPETVQNVVTYATIIRTQNPGEKLKPGMTANVSVLVARHDDVLKVPNAALRFRPAGAGMRGGRGGAGGAGGAAASGGSGGPGAAFAATPPGGAGGAGGSAGRHGGMAGAGTDSMRSGGAGRGGEGGRGAWAGRGGAGGGWHGRGRGAGDSSAAGMARGGMARGAMPVEGGMGAPRLHPGAVYRLVGGKPLRVRLLSGDTDGAFTQVESDSLHEGDLVITGLELPASAAGNTQAAPGMGSPFGGPGGGRGGRGR